MDSNTGAHPGTNRRRPRTTQSTRLHGGAGRDNAGRHSAGGLSDTSGVSLIELLVVIAVIAAIAAPNLSSLMENRRLAGAADAILGEFQFARSQGINQSMDTYVLLSADPTEPDQWVTAVAGRRVDGRDHAENCDPWEADSADADACTYEVADSDAALTAQLLRRLRGSDFRDIDVVLDAGTDPGVADMIIRFDSVRGVAVASDGSNPTAGGADWTWRATVSVANPNRELQVRVNRLGRSWICQPPPSTRYVECQ